MKPHDVTEKIVCRQGDEGIKLGPDVAAKVGMSKEWVTAACWQMCSRSAGPPSARFFGLSAEERRWLCVVPYQGRSLPTAITTILVESIAFYELVNDHCGTHVQGN